MGKGKSKKEGFDPSGGRVRAPPGGGGGGGGGGNSSFVLSFCPSII
eukprot:COSAG06_NODE_61385_length_268_cov_0.502959_1_plen_45_part_01